MNFKKSAIALALIASAASMSAFAQDNTQALTRAQVQADLHAYKQSGLDALSSTEQGADTNSAEYKAALARYQQLTGKSGQVAAKPLSREEVKADLSAWKAAGLPDAVAAIETADVNSAQYKAALATYHNDPASAVALSRDAVRADLNAWKESGMSALTSGEQGVDTNSAQYKAAAARYEQLRNNNS